MTQVGSDGNRTGRNKAGKIGRAGCAVLLAVALVANGCGLPNRVINDVTGGPAGPANGTPGFVRGFLGGVAADEPSAALVGREVLSAGGSAADAAVAVGFALAVTLPSRAGLGGGGACIAYDPARKGPNKGVPEAVLFVPPAPAQPGPADRPAAVPMLARGLYLLHSRYGTRRFDSLIAPAEQMARDGVTVSRSLAHDLSVVAGPLSADPGARAVFFPGGVPVKEGARFLQPGLSGTLAELRRSGVGDLYQGVLAHMLAESARDAGAGLTVPDLRDAVARFAPVLELSEGETKIGFLPPPADGGLAAAAAFAALQQAPADLPGAGARALAVAARWRQGGGDPRAVLAAAATLPAASLPALPASTSFVVIDRGGDAVACALTMNNLFGNGRVAAGTGILFAASPTAVPPPLLAAAVAWQPRKHAFRAVVGGSGQDGAPLATALAMRQALGAAAPGEVPAPGRANVIDCPGLLPGTPNTCTWAVDPRGSGLAIGNASGGAIAPEKPALPDNYAPAPGVPTYR